MTSSMTSLTTARAAAVLPEGPPAPRPPSPALARAMRLVVQARAADAEGEALTSDDLAAVFAEARRRLDGTVAALDQRAEPSVIQQWLLRVMSLIGHPNDADQIADKLEAMRGFLADVPRRCLTIRSASMVAEAAGRFFPPAKDLLAIIQPEAADLVRDRDRLRAVLRAAERQAPPPTLSPEERAAMSAAAKAYLQESAQRRAEREAQELATTRRDASARALATSPETTEAEIRVIAAGTGPGAALARARLVLAERQRLSRSLSPSTTAELPSP